MNPSSGTAFINKLLKLTCGKVALKATVEISKVNHFIFQNKKKKKRNLENTVFCVPLVTKS